MTDTIAVSHQIRGLSHNAVRGDRLHVCLHDILVEAF